jgi:hypothetical protein
MSIGNIWNEKFSREGYLYGKEPNAFLKGHIDALQPSSILFLGEGEGRSACYAAAHGHTVTALDASAIGLAKAQQLALEKSVAINLIHADLEQWEPEQQYDAVMCSFLHLQEPLRTTAFRNAMKALKPQGKFYGEFFATSQLPLTSGGPKNIDLLYTVDSLRDIFSFDGVQIQSLTECSDLLDEGVGHQGDANLIRIEVTKL